MQVSTLKLSLYLCIKQRLSLMLLTALLNGIKNINFFNNNNSPSGVGLYPGMSSYRQNRYNLSNNNMTIPQALLPPVKIVYLPLTVQEAPNQHQKDNNKLKIESLE